MSLKFDCVFRLEFEGNIVEGGCMVGNNKIVYIKSGMGGSYLGYEDKYLKIANLLHDKYGCSVICVSNPVQLPISVDKTILCDFIKEYGVNNHEMFFFGHSNGGAKGLELAASGIAFKRMVLINMPLMLNFHKMVNWIQSIPETEIVTVYGDKDPSCSYIPFLENKKLSNVEILKIQGADHHFKGMMETFIELSENVMCKTNEML